MRTFICYATLLLATNVYAKKFGGGGRSHGTSHSYPHSTGYSGTGTGTHTYNQGSYYQGTGGSHSYPQSTGYSGNNHVPKQTVYQNNVNHAHKTEVQHHYHNHYYSPPQHIGYGHQSFPVYHAAPPVYVYQYRDSGSRFDTLLTGLALYNLGRMSSSHSHYDPSREYRGVPGETCKLGIKKSNGDYEETRVECRLMTSFIMEPSQPHVVDQQRERKTVTTTVTNVTQTNHDGGNSTVTVINTTVVDALQAKGESIEVTPGMYCYLIRITRDSSMRKEIECGLLQTYAQTSWRNSAERLTPILSMFIFQIFLFQVI